MFKSDQFYYEHPNFSIKTPGGCNAKCPFCFYTEENELSSDEYKLYLADVLSNIPEQCDAVSITGGEPTISPMLPYIIRECIDHGFDRIVLTTNGLNFGSFDYSSLGDITGGVTHLNFSYHHHDVHKRMRMFGLPPYVIHKDALDLTSPIHVSHLEHIESDSYVDISISCTLSDQFLDYEEFVTYIDHVVTNADVIKNLFIRVDHAKGIADDHYFEQMMFEDGRFKYVEGRSNDCVKHGSYRYKDSNVKIDFKYAVLEPTSVLPEGTVYEYIVQPNGLVTLDWAGTKIEYNYEEDCMADLNEVLKAITALSKQVATISDRLDNYERKQQRNDTELASIRGSLQSMMVTPAPAPAPVTKPKKAPTIPRNTTVTGGTHGGGHIPRATTSYGSHGGTYCGGHGGGGH